MAVKSKGFVYTLEAVIASTIVLGMALFVIPEASPDPEPDFQTVETGLKSLDDRNQLGNSPSEVSDNIERYVPSGYNVTSRIVSINRTESKVSGESDYRLEDGYKELLLWIDSTDNLEITFKDVTVVDSDQTGYREFSLGDQAGYLNFSGTSDLQFRVNRYNSQGSFPDSNSIYTTNYIESRGGEREIQVIIWE